MSARTWIVSVVTSAWFLIALDWQQITVQATIICNNNTTLDQSKAGRCTTYDDNVVLGNWYIWVALIAGLILLSVVTAIYHRYRMRNRVTYLNAIATGHRGNMTVQIISGQQQSFAGHPIVIPTINAYGNPGHYFEPPAAGYIMQPPPYSPAKRTAAPPPYRNNPTITGNNFNGMSAPAAPMAGEKDKEMGLSVIHPMQPAYMNPGGPMDAGMNYPHTPLYDNPPNMYGNFTGSAFLTPNYPVRPPSYPGVERVPSAVQSGSEGTRTPGAPNVSPSHSRGTSAGNVRPTTSARSTVATPTSAASMSPRTPAPGGVSDGAPGAPASPVGPPPAPLMETRHM